MAIQQGTLTAGTPPGVDEGWFTPEGPFVIRNDSAGATLALHMRDGEKEKGQPGAATGDTIQPGTAMQGSAGYRGGIQYRVLIASGSGNAPWKAYWS